MKEVQNKIVELFPHERFTKTEQNVLLSTIRIPNNIMYLSDKLPKPCYNLEFRNNEVEKGQTLSSKCSLPAITPHKSLPPKKLKRPYYFFPYLG